MQALNGRYTVQTPVFLAWQPPAALQNKT